MTKKENFKIGGIIQARMGSSRLPGKILKKIDKNMNVLELLIRRVKYSKKLNEIIIATTPDKKNLAIIELAKKIGVKHFVGSEEDVLDRYFEASKRFNLDVIVRLTSDNPFVDPAIIDNMIDFYLNKSYDYISNDYEITRFPTGFHIEVFSFNILEHVHSLATSPLDKEHVTYYIYTHPDMFSIYYYDLENLKTFNGLRLTIDEKEDLIICREVLKKLKEKNKPENFSIHDIMEVIEENPSLININKHIVQKKV